MPGYVHAYIVTEQINGKFQGLFGCILHFLLFYCSSFELFVHCYVTLINFPQTKKNRNRLGQLMHNLRARVMQQYVL